MTVEQLMSPRYKVIALMPVLPFQLDEIYNADFVSTNVRGQHYYTRLDIYPHLFKKLEWWEDRKPEEMPEYVKDLMYDDKIVKVVAYFKYEHEELRMLMENEREWVVTKNVMPFFEPATEEEYNAYKNAVR